MAVCVLTGWLTASACAESPYAARQKQYLANLAKAGLPQGQDGDRWVDANRWAVAHALLATNTRLDEANRYFRELRWASMWHGLVEDSDIQATDLLRTFCEFKDSPRLSADAKANLIRLLSTWQPPHRDRNRDADTRYEWPCEYTENHSLNILAASYLNDHLFNRERTLRRQLLERFLHDRARWGWSEFNSPRYALTTLKALTLLHDFAPDESVRKAATMLLDVHALVFANEGLHYWRGLPGARGGPEINANSYDGNDEVMRLWFGDPPGSDGAYEGGGFLAHFMTTTYEPPQAARQLLADLNQRGRYVMRNTATTGPAKLRVPIAIWVTPSAVMASAQGFGHYYDGAYCAIAFASDPRRAITATYGSQRNLFQHENVVATFGTVRWIGDFNQKTDGELTIGEDASVFVGQLSLAGDCHLLMIGEKSIYATRESFAQAINKLNATFANGTVTWTSLNGAVVRMVNERHGEEWRMAEALVNDGPVRLDSNMLYDSPHLRSVRGSAVIEARVDDRAWVYDFTDLAKPTVREGKGGAFPPLPSEHVKGPIGIEFVSVPAGEFPMGAPAGEGRENEQPLRWVNVDAFYISKTEITVGQYKAYLAANPKAPTLPDWYYKEWGKTDAYAITYVTWEQAQAFCAWLSAQDKDHGYRLPTEAEWEKAAKGYAHRPYPWGEGFNGTQAGTPNGEYAEVGTHPRDRSPFGALDMAGGVWEWCADWYAPAPGDVYRNPIGPARGTTLALRGCSWNFDPDTFRTTYRSSMDPTQRAQHIGFRVVRVER